MIELTRWLLNQPGRMLDILGAGKAPDDACSGTGDLPDTVFESPRANAYLSLEPGLSTFYSDNSLLTYFASGRNVFAVGGLHGQEQTHTPILRTFLRRLRENGFRRVLLFPVAPDEIGRVEAAGMKVLHVGAEPFLNPQRFSIDGRNRENLRQMVNRASKRYQLQVRELNPLTGREIMESVYDRWLADRLVPYAMQLLVGGPGFDSPFKRRYFAAGCKGKNRIEAFVTITPGWAGAGYGVDVMARRPDAPAGAMELLIYRVIQKMAAEGIEVFSLGGCPMSDAAGKTAENNLLLRPIFYTLYHSKWGNGLFNFASLDYFKSKFAERWEPVYIAGWPNAGPWTLYVGCRLWGLFGDPRLLPPCD